MRVCVILPAAGSGTRFGGDKLSQDLGGRPVLLRTVEAFARRAEVESIVVAGPADQEALAAFRERYEASLSFLGARLVVGGRTERWETVLRAIAAVSDAATHIAVHDAARPCVSEALLERLFAAARLHPAVIPGVPVSSTLKRVGPAHALRDPATAATDALVDGILGGAPGGDGDGGDDAAADQCEVRPVLETVPRAQLVAIQTPQIFERRLLVDAYRHAERTDALAGVTDDAQVVERFGRDVVVVPGDPRNIKITTGEDLLILRSLMESDARGGRRRS